MMGRRGLDFSRRRRRRPQVLLAAAALCCLPWLAARLPPALARADAALAACFVAHYEQRLTALQGENATLHARLAQSADALTENDALRTLLGCGRADGAWRPAQVVAQRCGGVTLAGAAAPGAAVLDAQGRYAGCVTQSGTDTCVMAFADGTTAGLAGGYAGLLDTTGGWTLTGLPADCTLAAGAIVTTPGGHWLGVLAAAPTPAADGLTASAPLTDTADLSGAIFFTAD